MEGPVHGFCSGVGTGGTLSGIGEVLKRQYPDIKIWAVEPEHAAILSGGSIGTHLQMGIGDGLIPKNLNTAKKQKNPRLSGILLFTYVRMWIIIMLSHLLNSICQTANTNR